MTRDLKLGIYADILALRAKTSVLPRESPGRVIGCDPATHRPFVRKSEVKKLCGAANARTRPRADIHLEGEVDVSRHCVGHVLKFALNHVLRSTLREFHRRSNISADHIRDIALQTFPATLAGRNPVASHHRRQMAEI